MDKVQQHEKRSLHFIKILSSIYAITTNGEKETEATCHYKEDTRSQQQQSQQSFKMRYHAIQQNQPSEKQNINSTAEARRNVTDTRMNNLHDKMVKIENMADMSMNKFSKLLQN